MNQNEKSVSKRGSHPRTNAPKRCARCKQTKPASDFYSSPQIKDGLTPACRPCMVVKDSQPPARFSRARSRAKKEKVHWDLELPWYAEQLAKGCYYCVVGSTSGHGSGIDRLDPSIGYTIANCVPCCWACNYVKSDMFYPDEMKLMGALMATFEVSRKNLGRTSLHVSYNQSRKK